MGRHQIIFALLLSLAAIHAAVAVDYTINNSAAGGGLLFVNNIGQQTLASATEFIWRTFQQSSPAERKSVDKVTLFIQNDMDHVSYAVNNEIHVNANYLGNYSGDAATREFTGLVYHEMTHIWQWDGNRQAPEGLLEGIADFMRLEAHYGPSNWVKPGEGRSWDQGHDVTAFFLDYLNEQRKGFVAELNKKLKSGYDASYFVDLLGKSVDQLWTDYKAKYSK